MIQELETEYGTMFVPDTDLGQYWWLANTRYSPEDIFIDPICEILKERPKGCAIDVGANFGCWTLPLARVAHSVIAIEPQAGVRTLLSRTLEANKIRNVRLMGCAASDRNGIVCIESLDLEQDYNFGGVQITDERNPNLDAISCQPLDAIAMGERVSFIKIDVEGHETKVLAGASQIIKFCRPILFVEKDHADTDEAFLRKQLESMDYGLQTMGGNFLGMPL